MNKWSRNSIYGAGLASLLYLGCGNSVQNIDTKVQEDTDLSLADKNLDDFYQPTDSSLEDRINPIDSRELDYPSEDSSSEIQGESDILPDSLEYDNNPDYNLNDLSRDDYSIDLGTDYANEDTSLSNDLNYCNSLEINSPEWCENCNTAPTLINAYIENPNPNNEYKQGERINVCFDVSDPNNQSLTCSANTDNNNGNAYNCITGTCKDTYSSKLGPQYLYAVVSDPCGYCIEEYNCHKTFEINIISDE